MTNRPGVLTDCSADLAITLMLAVARDWGAGISFLNDRSSFDFSWRVLDFSYILCTKISKVLLEV